MEQNQFTDLTITVAQKIKNQHYFGKNIFIMLVGHPLCGKDTFLNELKGRIPEIDIKTLSFDDIVNEMGAALEPKIDYNDAFDRNNENAKKLLSDAEKELKRRFAEYGNCLCVVSNTTQLSPERRRINLSKFPDHYRLAIHFEPLAKEEFLRRNEMRKAQTGKDISERVLDTLMSSYKRVDIEEGFNEVIYWN